MTPEEAKARAAAFVAAAFCADVLDKYADLPSAEIAAAMEVREARARLTESLDDGLRIRGGDHVA